MSHPHPDAPPTSDPTRLATVDRVLAGLAHDINAPLATVLTNLDVVLERLDELDVSAEAVRPLVGPLLEARGGVDQIAEVVQVLLQLTRGSNSTSGTCEPDDAVRLAVAMTAFTVRHRARLVVDPQARHTLRGDLTTHAELLVHLLLDTVEALPEGHAADHEVRLTLRDVPGGRVRVCVHSDEVGVIDPSPPVAALMARIGAQAAGQGLDLPAVPEAAPQTPVATGQARVAPGRGRVLLVDDDPMVRTALTRALGRRHHIESVASGREALARIEDEPHWDVIVCDLMMPDTTGRQLHEHLRQHHPELARRLIFVTGGAFTASDQAFLDSVPNPVLDKPFRLGVLRDLIAAAVALSSPEEG